MKPDVHILVTPQLTPELVGDMCGIERIILIDANLTGEPGKVSVGKIDPRTRWHPETVTHDLQASDLLALCKELYHAVPETYLVTVAGATFDFTTELSDAATRAIPEVVECVKNLLE